MQEPKEETVTLEMQELGESWMSWAWGIGLKADDFSKNGASGLNESDVRHCTTN